MQIQYLQWVALGAIFMDKFSEAFTNSNPPPPPVVPVTRGAKINGTGPPRLDRPRSGIVVLSICRPHALNRICEPCGHPTTGVPARVPRDTQRHATPPEPVPLHNISSTSSCVYSNHNVHINTLNKVSTPLPLVLITSYCVGTSTDR